MKLISTISKILMLLFLAILIIFFIRTFSERQVDDVTPGIPCESSILAKSDVLYVIPKFENKSIADNKTWCAEILAMNKTLALHGVYHTYNEFKTERDEKYLQEGIDIFKECFGFNPNRFKPPQLAISKENRLLIRQRMQLDVELNTALHKAYHCNDSGVVSNRIMDIF
jgi:predicted deacetylase